MAQYGAETTFEKSLTQTDCCADTLHDLIGDVVAVTLAHLLAVETRNDLRVWIDSRLRQFKNLPKRFVDLYRQIARDLNVLLLIFADRHGVAVVNQNVCRHQDGITEEANGGRVPAREFVFIRMRALEKSHRRDGRQNPGEFGDLRYVRLSEKGGALGIETACQKVQRDLP